MKNMICLLTALLALPAAAAVNVDADNQLINWTPTYNLEINLVQANVSDEQYAILAYDWYLNQQTLAAEYQNLQTSYPNYEIKRNDVEAVSNLTLSIPSAKYQIALTTLPGQAGLYAEDNQILNKKQYLAIMDAKKNDPNGYAKLAGTATTHESVYKVIETKTLTPAICQSLYGNGTMADVLKNVFSYGAATARTQAIKNAATETLFSNAIETSCFAPDSTASIDSMRSLLGLRLKMVLSQPISVNYKVVNSVSVDGPAPYRLSPWQEK